MICVVVFVTETTKHVSYMPVLYFQPKFLINLISKKGLQEITITNLKKKMHLAVGGAVRPWHMIKVFHRLSFFNT